MSYKVSNLTTGLVLTHVVVSLLVIFLYDKISAVKNMKLVQKYKNVVLWLVSGIVCALILADMSTEVNLSGIEGNNADTSFMWETANPIAKTLLVATILHLIVSFVLLIPFFYNMIISILPTKSYKNQILWCVSFVVCLIMAAAVIYLRKDELVDDNNNTPEQVVDTNNNTPEQVVDNNNTQDSTTKAE